MSAARKRALGAVSAIAALSLAGGIAAQFTTSTSSAPQNIGTGTMALSLDNVAPTVWTDPIENLAAGDSVQRFVDLRNSGPLKMSGITLSQTNTLGSLLTDPSDVRLTLESCSVAWNTTTGTCAGTQMVVLGQNSVRAWADGTKSLATFDTFGAGEVRHLRFTTQLAPGATNAVQGKNGQITYTFSGVQRAGNTWGSSSDAYTPLNAPTNVTVAPYGDALVASWTDTNNGQVPYTVGYAANGGSVTKVALPKGVSSYTLTNPVAGATYDFSVFATAGAEAATVPAPSVSILQAPALTVTQTGTTSLKATITDNSGGKASYKLTYTPAGGTAQTINLPAGTLTYDLTGLQLATDYTIVATATQGTQVKSTSAVSTLALSQPGAVALTATDTTMKVDWTDTNAGQATYTLSYAPAAGGSSVSVPLMAGQFTKTVTGLNASTSYIFTLSASKNGKTAVVSSTKSTSAPVGVDLSTATWKYVGNSPSAYGGIGNGSGFANVGDTNGNLFSFSTSATYKYNIASNAWSSLTPSALGQSNTAVLGLDGMIYNFGAGANKNIAQKYDPATNAWTKLATIPAGRSDGYAVVASDGSIYVLGGYTKDYAASNSVQKYDPVANSWTTLAPMPNAREYLGATFDSSGKLVVVGGGTYNSLMDKYDPVANSWTSATSPNLAAVSAAAYTTDAKGNLYRISGISSTGTRLGTYQKYDITSGTWTTKSLYNNSPHVYGGAFRDSAGYLWIMSGLDNNGYTYSMEKLS